MDTWQDFVTNDEILRCANADFAGLVVFPYVRRTTRQGLFYGEKAEDSRKLRRSLLRSKYTISCRDILKCRRVFQSWRRRVDSRPEANVHCVWKRWQMWKEETRIRERSIMSRKCKIHHYEHTFLYYSSRCLSHVICFMPISGYRSVTYAIYIFYPIMSLNTSIHNIYSTVNESSYI